MIFEDVDSARSLRAGEVIFEDFDAEDTAGAGFGMIREGDTELNDVVVTIDVVLALDSARLRPVL